MSISLFRRFAIGAALGVLILVVTAAAQQENPAQQPTGLKWVKDYPKVYQANYFGFGSPPQIASFGEHAIANAYDPTTPTLIEARFYWKTDSTAWEDAQNERWDIGYSDPKLGKLSDADQKIYPVWKYTSTKSTWNVRVKLYYRDPGGQTIKSNQIDFTAKFN